MRNDTILRQEGMRILAENLGLVEAERFISLIICEPFDYTKWQENLLDGLSIEEISRAAQEHRSKNSLF